MNTITSKVISKVNRYIYEEEIRKEVNDYIVNNGVLVGKIGTVNGTKELYYKL